MPFAPPVILLDKDDTLHPNITHFAQVMSAHYAKHNYKTHLTAHQVVMEDYYLHNSAVHMFCATVHRHDPLQARQLEEQIFADVTALVAASLAPHVSLNSLLRTLRQQGCVFGLITHNSRQNTTRDLVDIGLADFFDPRLVLAYEDLGESRKTTPSAYRLMAERLKQVVPHHGPVYMLDDHPSNLAPVSSLGWHPVQIGDAPRPPSHTWPQHPSLEDFLLHFSRQMAA